MKGTLQIVGLLLGVATAASAAETIEDPVSGAWGNDERTFLELKLDDKGGVTGTAFVQHRPGTERSPIRSGTLIRSGRFDRTTGALRLLGESRTPLGQVSAYTIEGTITGNTLSGRLLRGASENKFEFRRYAGATPEQRRANHEQHKGDFDYLLGDWEFTAQSKQWGAMRGYWSAVRLDEGQILDEYRVVGDEGQTYYVTSTLRNYNSARDQWELVGADAGGGLQDVGTARRVGSEMHVEQTFGVAAGDPSVWKIRYFDIQADRFSWTADRSTDGGKTWVEKYQTIEARRLGPTRSLGALAPARPKAAAAAPAK